MIIKLLRLGCILVLSYIILFIFNFRFIPNRATTDMEYGHYAVMKRSEEDDDQAGSESSQNNGAYQEVLKDALGAGDKKILNFKTKAPEPAGIGLCFV